MAIMQEREAGGWPESRGDEHESMTDILEKPGAWQSAGREEIPVRGV